MKRLGGKFWIFLPVLVLCAGIIVVVACSEDEKCKKCTNSVTNASWTACGDELEEAQKLPNVTCK